MRNIRNLWIDGLVIIRPIPVFRRCFTHRHHLILFTFLITEGNLLHIHRPNYSNQRCSQHLTPLVCQFKARCKHPSHQFHQPFRFSHKVASAFHFTFFEEHGVIRQHCLKLAGTSSPEELSHETKLQLCLLSYHTIHTHILYDDNDEIDEEGLRGVLKQLSNFFREMIQLIEHIGNTHSGQKERSDALLADHMKCRARLQAAFATFKKEGQTAQFFEDFNECGRLVGLLLANHFASLKEDH